MTHVFYGKNAYFFIKKKFAKKNRMPFFPACGCYIYFSIYISSDGNVGHAHAHV